jgi:hypothetical protein
MNVARAEMRAEPAATPPTLQIALGAFDHKWRTVPGRGAVSSRQLIIGAGECANYYSASSVIDALPLRGLLFPAPSHQLSPVSDKRCPVPVPKGIATDRSKDKGENKEEEEQRIFFPSDRPLGLLHCR